MTKRPLYASLIFSVSMLVACGGDAQTETSSSGSGGKQTTSTGVGGSTSSSGGGSTVGSGGSGGSGGMGSGGMGGMGSGGMGAGGSPTVCAPDPNDDPCSACAKNMCCMQVETCFNDTQCQQCLNCIAAMPNPISCLGNGCDQGDPETGALINCAIQFCSGSCM
ncbi:MAG: hypothetical protein KC731_19550 [Myxococcales bacterium]|nr:hypothetical protein [Myxococcales bacterium]